MRPTGRHASIFLLMLLGLTLAGCRISISNPIGGTSSGSISFEEIFEHRTDDQYRVELSTALDVDEDNEDEWLVLYRFDPMEGNSWANAPIHGVMYDAVRCNDVPKIREYELPTPDNDYLSEGGLSVTLQDVLDGATKADQFPNELVILGPKAQLTNLAIYRFYDRRGSPCQPVDESERGFKLLGFFRANAGVWREGERGSIIVTKDRTVFERSQLAVRKTYTPKSDPTWGQSYLQPNGRLYPPDEQTVDFTYSLPRDPRDSPYPEKSVATFYLALGNRNEKSQSFLADPLQGSFPTGLQLQPDDIGRVLIYSLSYTPNVDAERRREERIVDVVVAAVDKQGNRQTPRRIRWKLTGVPIPERQDCEWRLTELVSVTTLSPAEVDALVMAGEQPGS